MSGKSLKMALPEIAAAIGVTPDELYGCQRRLVVAGVLPSTPGRGPGSGTEATFANVARLMVGYVLEQPLASVAAMRRPA